jgi:hypothetical protein
MAIKIYCDKANEYKCMRHIIDCGLLNPGFRDANSYKEKFNLEEDKLSVEYNVKEFTEKSVLELSDNDLTFFKMCIYFMRDRLKADIETYKSILKDLEYSGLSTEISVYIGMTNRNEKIITQCSEWLKRLEQV